MDVLLIALLIVLNGVFAMSELALASCSKARLQAMQAAGVRGAAWALRLVEQPTHFLSTVQVGITSIGVLNGIVGEAALSPVVEQWLQALGLAQRGAAFLATALVVAAITFATLIFGELVPKRIGQLFPEPVAAVVAPPMIWLARLARPFVWLLVASTQAMLHVLRIDTRAARSVTQEEIAESLAQGVDAGLIEAQEHQMVRNVFRLDDRALSSLMVPRSEVRWLDAAQSVRETLRALSASGHLHSWYPVCKGSMDRVQGIVGMAQMMALGMESAQTLGQLATPAVFVPETLSGMELLEQFRQHTGRMVFVVDEYGEVQGIMTPRDLLEAITGELQPAAYQQAWATQRSDGSWLIDGLMPVQELKARLQMLAPLPGEDSEAYNTLAGLFMFVSGHLPVVTERMQCAGWNFEIVDMDGRRIDKVLAWREDGAASAPEG